MKSLLFFIAACLVIELLGAWATFPSIDSGWYAGLLKPALTPPNWVFGPVWTVLYLMIAVSGWLVWKQRKVKSVWVAMAIYDIQLILNVVWSYIFFAGKNPTLGLIDITLLWLAIGILIGLSLRIDRRAGILLTPYWLWVSYATFLNFSIWRLNAG